jgi:hypothetical protein
MGSENTFAEMDTSPKGGSIDNSDPVMAGAGSAENQLRYAAAQRW